MNPARPKTGALIARIEDIPDAGAVAVDFAAGDARYSLILARAAGRIVAYENRCPHAGFPLERPDGRVVMQEGRFLVCSAHGASFDMDTGACVGGPCMGRALSPLTVIVEDGGAVRMG